MSERILQFEYEATPDEDGIYDGRALARALIDDALKLLAPYAEGCRACHDTLFLALVNEAVAHYRRAAEAANELPSHVLGTEHATDLAIRMARHTARTAAMTRCLLERAEACNGAGCGHPSISSRSDLQ